MAGRWVAALAIAAGGCSRQHPLDVREAVARTAASLHSLHASPGFGFAVVQDGRTLLAGGLGCANVSTGRPFTASTPFYIASTTKAFMGLASAVLAERGRWNLDAPVSRYLPALRLQPPLDPSAITIRQLLTHTHGISNAGPVVTKLAYTGEYSEDEELMRLMRMHPPEPTGPAFSYGNIGYNVAAFAMAEATGLSWRNALESVLFEPLAMRGTTTFASLVDTGSVAQPYGATPEGFARLTVKKRDATMHSAGGVFSTPADMGRWLESQIGQGRIDDVQVIPQAAMLESQRLVVRLSEVRGGVRVLGYGLGWQIGILDRDTILIHGGAFPGYTTLVSFIPRRRAGVVVMANNVELGVLFADLATRAFHDVLFTGRPISAGRLRSMERRLDDLRPHRGSRRYWAC